MIRVYKRHDAPQELAEKGYGDDAVSKAMLEDQYDKCYICERKTSTDYQVEHLVSRHGDISMENDWGNLFIACGYCNNKKKTGFDDIALPNNYNIEDVIEQRVDYKSNKAEFSSNETDDGVSQTINLLNRMFNGTGEMRTLREDIFFKKLIMVLNGFKAFISDFATDKSDAHRQAVINALDISSEYLGFKYWLIKDNAALYAEFKDYMVWNKK